VTPAPEIANWSRLTAYMAVNLDQFEQTAAELGAAAGSAAVGL
jgi:hypothetical protein